MVLRLLLNFVYLSFSHASPNASDFSFVQEAVQDFCLNCNNGGASTGSIIEEVSHWLRPALQTSVQPCTEDRVEEGKLLPVMPMQNKCTQKWHRWGKITVCFKARKTVTRNCLQRITLISPARHYFLHSAQLADIIPWLFKAHTILGQQVKKQTSKRAADTSFFSCQFRVIQNSGGNGASGFC